MNSDKNISTESTSEPLAREVFNDRQSFLPQSGVGVKRTSEIFSEAQKAAGRYRSPQSPHGRWSLQLQQKIAELGTSNDSFIPSDASYPVPPQWQAIPNYLFEQKILTSPRAVFEPPFNDEPKLFYLHLQSQFDKTLTDGHDPQQLYNRGTSLHFEEALSKAIGELLERHFLSLYRKEKLVRSSLRSLKKKGVLYLDPANLAEFSEEQKQIFPERRFNDADEFFWTPGRKLGSSIPVLLPAQCVFWNYCHHAEYHEPFLQQPITNGAAGHFSLEEAVILGIYELIQRDAFLIHWLNAIAPPRVDISALNHPDAATLLALCRRYHLEPTILNITTDIPVPTFAAIIIDRSGRGPSLTIGGGCDAKPEIAVVRALSESLGIRQSLRTQYTRTPELKTYRLSENYSPFREEIGQEGRLALWANPETLRSFSFFLEGAAQLWNDIPARTFSSKKEELAWLQGAIEKLGPQYAVYFYEATHTVLDTLGYHSVRVVIPPLIPLYMKEHAVPLGAARLKHVPEKLGHRSRAAFNPLPHPFP